jgi:hypothetical protein
MINMFAQSELESTKRDAESSAGKTADERIAMFMDLMRTVEAIRSNLPPEQRARQMRISEMIDPRPEPWWRNFRKEALVEYQCQTSST